MATSAFKSTTKRMPIAKPSTSSEDSPSSNRILRRSRSLSRFSHRLPAPPSTNDLSDEPPPTRGRFVNKTRGSAFPEISLDDLAIEFFDSPNGGGSGGFDRGRSTKLADDVSGGSSAQRRGRSVSRKGSSGSVGNFSGGGSANSGSNSRRRRSVSVVKCQISDSESDLEHSQNSSYGANVKKSISGSNQKPLSYMLTASNLKQGLRRSISQKDLKHHDGYSSQSSTLTDEEGREAHSDKNGIEKTIRAVYAKNKAEHPISDDVNNGLYEAMRKELRYAVEEIKMELEQGMTKTKSSVLSGDDCLQSKSSDVLQAVCEIKKNYMTKLERSEKRKQDLLAEILLEEQRGREISKIVNELLPEEKNIVEDKPLRTRKRNTDRSCMSECLSEEAEKFIEDFLSSVEDTDISSLDGEKSDTSSTLGGMTKTEVFQSPAAMKSLPVEMDGVVLPWLQWETTNDTSSLSCKNMSGQMVTPKTKVWNAVQGATTAQDLCNCSFSSRGSWSPGVTDGLSINTGEDSRNKFRELGSSYQSKKISGGARPQFDMDEYLVLKSDEDTLLERLSQQQRINSGCLQLCNQMFF
ncbi:hypothetical protein CFOL_v3_30594 [Cephalotus follicularis]|uniref:Uncharacterized protein n=1 Tax=Cephalotus follicularis TaxID=3775 RepID=A0A1Q3D4H2_CEPFO|nr:hypothetical protein CFOL_v3_30594 [Cephalotus follicularis]